MVERPTKTQRRAVYVILALIGLAGCGALMLWLLHQRVQTLLETRVQSRGWRLDVEQLRVGLLGTLHIEKACVSLEADDHADLCAHGIRARLHPRSIFQRQPVIQHLHIDNLAIETTKDRLAGQRRDHKPNNTAHASGSSRRPRVQHVTIDTTSVSLRDAERTGQMRLSSLTLDRTDTGYTVRAHGTLQSIVLANATWNHAAQAAVDRSAIFEATLDTHGAPSSMSLQFDTPLSVPVPNTERGHASIRAMQFQWPYTVIVVSPTLTLPSFETHGAADAIEVNVGLWTLDPSQIYLASAIVHNPTVDISLEHLSPLLKAASAWKNRTTVTENEETAAQDLASDPSSPSPRASSAQWLQRIAHRLLSKRSWWEILPRAIDVENARVHLRQRDANMLTVSSGNLSYAVRVLRRQMDLRWSANLDQQDHKAGSVHGRFQWHYAQRQADLRWRIDSLDLHVLSSLSVPFIPSGLSIHGLLSTKGHLQMDPDRHVRGHQQAQLEQVRLEHDRLQQPLILPPIVWSGNTGGTPIVDDAPTTPLVVLSQQRLQWGNAQATFGLQLDRSSNNSVPAISAVHIDVHIPPQPVMTLWQEIPSSLLGTLQGTQMDGTWGMDLGFDILRTSPPATAQPAWHIERPRFYSLHDSKLSLLSLPEDVDVQRLNGPMRFVFRGPNDSFMRPIDIPSPSPRNDNGYGTTPNAGTKGSHPWVPLDDMSFYLIATQLYREDGSFFRNSGINWLQIRHVLSDALNTGEVKRGASTITMQTVKNVFLSHEKSAERKLQELFLSYWLTRTVSKARILEIYLNIIELAPDRNGVEEASQFYFGQSVRGLGVRESVWLSAISPNPVMLGGGKAKSKADLDRCKRCDQLIVALHNRGWFNDEERHVGLRKTTDQPAVQSLSAIDRFETDYPAIIPGLPPFDWRDDQASSTGGVIESPPLFDLLESDENEQEEARFEHLSTDERLRNWVEQSRPLMGSRAR